MTQPITPPITFPTTLMPPGEPGATRPLKSSRSISTASGLNLAYSSPYTFNWEFLQDLMAEGATRLVEKHYEEIALDKAQVPLDIDWSELLLEEQNGNWGVFIGRYNGKVIGYISWWFKRPYRYQTTLYCHADVFWMAPEHRKGLTGYRLLKASLEALPRPCKIQWGEKITFRDGRVGLLLERLGLRATEVQYTGFLAGDP